MAASIIQLHATSEELALFISEVANSLGLQIVFLKFQPSFSCELVINLSNFFERNSFDGGFQVVLLNKEPFLNVSSQLQFYDHNPDFISFHFGTRFPNGLRQSTMGYKTDDVSTAAIGKEISKRLKKITKAGVLIINPKNGASSLAKEFRYTSGALALEKSGVQMLPSGGNLAKLGG